MELINGFEPQIGDTFEILSALIVVGEFGDQIVGSLPEGIEFDVQYNSDSVVLEAVPEPDGRLALLSGGALLAALARARRTRPVP